MEGRYTTMNDKSIYSGPEYPTEAHGSIPAFNSYEEEANFWDTHSITDFAEETEAVKVRATRGLSANVQVRFDPETDHELEVIARERGMKKATLIRTWVLERLRQDRNRHAS
jgi:hypothetical protein